MVFRFNHDPVSHDANYHRHLYSSSPISSEIETIVRNASTPWLELDIKFPWQAMLEEAKAIDHLFVSPQYPGQAGWHLACLHGLSTEKVEGYQHYGYASEDDCPYRWTEAGNLCPTIKKFFCDLWPFSNYYRLRLAKISPGGSIVPHTDYDDLHLGPVNFALSNPDGAALNMKGHGNVPYTPGSAFMLNVGIEHHAYNKSAEDRIHIICHGIWNKEMQNLIQRSHNKVNSQ